MELGLIGYPLSHSFSKRYFAKKFARENLCHYRYDNFPLPSISDFPLLLDRHPNLMGLNVTIPYKQAVIPYLHQLSEEAAKVGAVNTIVIQEDHLSGHNSDVYGFQESLISLTEDAEDLQALVLGTGGAAKAVWYVLDTLGISYQKVSRKSFAEAISYDLVTDIMLQEYRLIINTTPLGMHPDINLAPALPYESLTDQHFLYDLIYNPEETQFMRLGLAQGAKVKNGYDMLVLQAERSWEIWHEENR